VLNVDVERIGHFDPVPSGTLTPRSFQAAPLKNDQLSRLLSTLSKVSGGIDRETESNAQVHRYLFCLLSMMLHADLLVESKLFSQMVAAPALVCCCNKRQVYEYVGKRFC
jgi:hypothetical protein